MKSLNLIAASGSVATNLVQSYDLQLGGRLNKKDRLTGYGDSHVKDKTSYRPSYL